MELLKIKGLTVVRQRDLVLDAVSFALRRQKITGLTGPNGSGKSTLFEVILGFLKPVAGSVEKAANLSIAHLPQNPVPRKILPMNVRDFITTGTWGRTLATPALRVDEALHEFQIESLAEKPIAELSGGQWKKAAVARCLVQGADLYLLDEPFNHLDLETEQKLGHLLKRMSHEMGKTFFVISHDWHAMNDYFDHLLLLNRKIIAEGSVREVGELHMNWKDPSHHQWMHGDH